MRFTPRKCRRSLRGTQAATDASVGARHSTPLRSFAAGRRRVLAPLLGLLVCLRLPAADLFVATNGNDGWTGRLREPNAARSDGPFASLARARQAVRELKGGAGLPEGGVRVVVGGGVYPLERPLELTAEDSGTERSPVVYRAAAGEVVRVIGGRIVDGWEPVRDEAVRSQLDESARDSVRVADLRALGIADYGTPSGGGLEVFYRDEPMPLARWPNEGFVKIVEILGTTPVDVRGTRGCVEGIFQYEGDRPSRWVREADVWAHGYWFWDWADQRQRVKAIDPARRTIELAPPYHVYGYRKSQWYYVYNLLSEIDRPGEWYLDRAQGRLYFWPPSPPTPGAALVSVLPTLVTMKNVSHVTFTGFTFEGARGTAINVSGGASNRIAGCRIRNVGGAAIDVSGGLGHGVVSCEIYQCGAGGLSLGGGDRRALTPAGHFADNNHIHHYGRWRPMYSAGIGLSGVGQRATHNLIENAPHQAIGFSGNDHRIEYNEIHSVCFESNDAGAIYAGRDWTMRGTVIAHNYLHHITGFQGKGCVGVYLDDMYCGTDIVGNVFHKVSSAAFVGGGRDCRIVNNLFVDCQPAVHVDARALGWAHDHSDAWIKEARERGTVSGIDFRHPPYSERYPVLLRLIEDDPAAPKGNVVARNVCVGGRWDSIESRARPLVTFEKNLVNEDPHFVNGDPLTFRFEADSPALQLGFEPLPIDRMGLYRDEYRAEWPVKHSVRPAGK